MMRRALAWARKNLFATPFDALLTLGVLALLVRFVPPLLKWGVFDATWSGAGRAACEANGGACWVFVQQRLMQFGYGFYPDGERWRPNTAFLMLAVYIGLLLSRRVRALRFGPLLLVGLFPVMGFGGFALLYGGWFGLPVVETPQWGGLMLTLIIAITGMTASLPLGVVLALGRRSEMPLIRKLCVVFIELLRGVPLVTVLFMSSVMLPLFLPEGVTFDKLLRALVGVALFSSAYMAEVVRGGLQAIPRGQYEAAQALGLPFWTMQVFVILPQALRKVIPGIMNSFISLFKDTTLVLIIGMFDLLGIVQAALTDAEWIGYSVEGYVFVGLVFWVFCFSMSRFSNRLERRLDHGRSA